MLGMRREALPLGVLMPLAFASRWTNLYATLYLAAIAS